MVLDNITMATTKSSGGSKLGRDSQPKHLGIKINNGQKAKIGQIIVKQRGSKFLPGKNVKKASDDSLYAMKNGTVSFTQKRKKLFNGSYRIAKVVNVK